MNIINFRGGVGTLPTHTPGYGPGHVQCTLGEICNAYFSKLYA